MNQTEALRRLDEIEHLDPDPSIDIGALGIMQELAKSETGLRLLVDRYSSSPSANIVAFLALELAEQSSQSTPEKAPLIFEFIAKLRRRNDEAVLMSSLSAMERQIGFGVAWGDTPRPPSSLFPFLKHCLDFTGRHSVLVQFAVIEVISALCWRRLLTTAFEVDEIEWVRKKLDDLSGTDNQLLIEAVAELRQCVGEYESPVQHPKLA